MTKICISQKDAKQKAEPYLEHLVQLGRAISSLTGLLCQEGRVAAQGPASYAAYQRPLVAHLQALAAKHHAGEWPAISGISERHLRECRLRM